MIRLCVYWRTNLGNLLAGIQITSSVAKKLRGGDLRKNLDWCIYLVKKLLFVRCEDALNFCSV